MGLFDGFEAGWNSFVNNEWKQVENTAKDTGKVLISPSPITKIVTNPKKAWEDPASLLPIEIGSKGPVAKDIDKQWNDVKEDYTKEVKKNVDVLISPNPIISAATGHSDDIISDKSSSEKWDNVTSSVDEKVVTPVKETVQETINNVTKGLGDALPIIAIGGAAVLVLSMLLGRR